MPEEGEFRMRPNNNPEGKTNPGLAIGVIFMVLGLALMFKNSMGGGAVFFILGIVFLAGQKPVQNQTKTANQPRSFPTETQIRKSQADSERQLQGQALSPDGSSKQPVRQAPPAPRWESQIRENQTPSERQLQGQALAPDGNSELPKQTRQKSTARGFDVHMTTDEISRRADELKGLLDSGIITKDEYRDRLQKLR